MLWYMNRMIRVYSVCLEFMYFFFKMHYFQKNISKVDKRNLTYARKKNSIYSGNTRRVHIYSNCMVFR